MMLLIFYLLLALGVSFLCSLVESGILSLRHSHVAELVNRGQRSGRWLQQMKDNIEQPLAAILTLNTIAHTVGAAGVGAQALALAQARGIGGQSAVAVISGILTLLILVFSEIIPKTLGAVKAGTLAPFTAYAIRTMIFLTYPLVLVFNGFTRVLGGGEREQRLTREEFALLAELGQAEGALDEREYRVIRNLLRMHKITAAEVMTPRTVVFMLPKDQTIEQAVKEHGPLRFARIPVYDGGPDRIVGLAYRPEVYESYRSGQAERTLGEIAKPIHAVPEQAPLDRVLAEFVQRREQLFLAVDEYGGTAGIITLEDAIETLLGEEIVDETDQVADMRRLAGRIFENKVRGRRF